jgi:hypothetical protein
MTRLWPGNPADHAPTMMENNVPKGYWIARIDITDPERYMNYGKASA